MTDFADSDPELLVSLVSVIESKDAPTLWNYLASLELDSREVAVHLLTGTLCEWSCGSTIKKMMSSFMYSLVTTDGRVDAYPSITILQLHSALDAQDVTGALWTLFQMCSPIEADAMKRIISGDPSFKLGTEYVLKGLGLEATERYCRTTSFHEAINTPHIKRCRFGLPYVPMTCKAVTEEKLAQLLNGGDLSRCSYAAVQISMSSFYVQVHISSSSERIILFDERGRNITSEIPEVCKLIAGKIRNRFKLVSYSIIEGFVTGNETGFMATDCIVFNGEDVPHENINLRKMHARHILGDECVVNSRLVVSTIDFPEASNDSYWMLTRIHSQYSIGGCSDDFIRPTIKPGQKTIVKAAVLAYKLKERIQNIFNWELTVASYNPILDRYRVIETHVPWSDGDYFAKLLTSMTFPDKSDKLIGLQSAEKVNYLVPEIVVRVVVTRNESNALKVLEVERVFPFSGPEKCTFSEVQ